MLRRTPSARGRAASPRRLSVLVALAAVLLTQLGPLPTAVTAFVGHRALHPCGCTGAVCVCPHPKDSLPSCHLPAKDVVDAKSVFDTCNEPQWDGAPAVPAVLTAPAAAPGPAFGGRLEPALPHRPLALPGGLDPPPPRGPSVA